MSNPSGENFQKWAEGNRLPTYGQIMGKLKELRSKPAKLQPTPNIPLNHKQRLFRDIVHNYAKQWHCANYEEGQWPKPLRLFLSGDP